MIWEVVSDGPVFIGRPIANTQVYVLDRSLKPKPIGVAGELFIGGDGLARGYINHPELTADRFIPNPYRPGSASRLYKTGDLCRPKDDGNVEHLGRLDNQVKMRGFRIELGDVEAALCKHSKVKEAVVLVQERAGEDRRLAAYVVSRPGNSLHAEELRQHLLGLLPEYMVPSAFLVLDNMPLTPNGKIDRLALRKPEAAKKAVVRHFVAPRDELELQLACIWRSVLKVSSISVKDDFFALGGHSLLAGRMFAKTEKVFNRRIPLATIFKASTVEKLACLLRQQEWRPNWSSLVAVQPGGSLPPLFLCHGADGNVLLHRDLALRLGLDQPVYGLQSQGLDGSKDFSVRLEEVAAHYVAEIRSLQPEGPYYLGGYCMGGAISFEMAQQLHAQGQKVALLALFETYNTYSNPKNLSFPYKLYHCAQTLIFHLENLVMLSREDAFAFFSQKARVQRSRIKAALAIWFAARLPRVRASERPMYPHVSLTKIHDHAFEQYRPRAFPGRLILFRPQEELRGTR